MAMPAITSTTIATITSRTPRTFSMPQIFRRMRWVLSALAGAVLLAPASSSGAQDEAALRATPDGRPLALTFADEFDSFRPLRGRLGVWRTTFGDGTHLGLDRRSLPTNGELQIYVDPDISG